MVERIGRTLPSGNSDYNENLKESQIDVLVAVFDNLSNEATRIDNKLTVQTDSKKEKVLNWNLEQSVYNLSPDGSSGSWTTSPITNKNDIVLPSVNTALCHF